MSRLLRALPGLATVGVGSLPFAVPETAARHATRAYDVPFCPQLPVVDGDMIHEWLGADPARCGWTPDRDRELPRGWDALVACVRKAPPVHGIVKLQVTGPLTLAAGLERAAGRPGCGTGVLELAAEIASWLAGNAAQQVRQLAALGLDTLVVIDEPGLAYLGAEAGQAALWDPLRVIAPAWGLHVCGPVPWALVEAAEPDVLSFDLVRYGLEADARRVLAARMRRGQRVALGVLDPSAPDGAPRAAARTAEALQVLAGAASRSLEDAAATTLLTPSCGTGRLSPERERLVAAQLGGAALMARAFASAPQAAIVEDGDVQSFDLSAPAPASADPDAADPVLRELHRPPPTHRTGG